MNVTLLYNILTSMLAGPTQQAAQVTADHALDVATLGFYGVVATVIGTVIVALVNKGRQDRSSAKSDDALSKVSSLEETILSMAKEVSQLREAAKRRAVADRQKEEVQKRWRAQMEAHVKEQDMRISELETYISQVDGVLSSATDDTTIGVLRPQLPVKPSMRRSQRQEEEVNE